MRDLVPFGILPLTGEADSLSMRILCDLTTDGRRIVAEAYGLKEDGFADGWNDGVGSCLLPRDGWQIVAVIALVKNYHTVLICENCIVALSDNEEIVHAEWQSEEDGGLVMTEPYKIANSERETVVDCPTWMWGDIKRVVKGCTNTRNTHQMSGRVE